MMLTQNPDLNSALLIAAWKGDTSMVIALLDRGADVDFPGKLELPEPDYSKPYTCNPLYYVARREGVTPLMLAAGDGNSVLVERLIARGANINAGPHRYLKPITLAARCGHIETTRVLVNAGADINNGKSDEEALIHWTDDGVSLLVSALLDRGAPINTRDDRGRTPLLRAVANSGFLGSPCNGRHVNLVQLLLERGADPNIPNKYGLTALMFAGDRPTVVRLLLKHGADVSLKDIRERTALRWAALQGHSEIVRLLEQAGAME